MTKHSQFIRTNDYLVVWKQVHGEWIPNFDNGTIYSTKVNRNLIPCLEKTGYYTIRFRTISGAQHRVYLHHALWVMKNGIPCDPNLEIDHINCDKTDNRIQNLRLVTPSENQRNRPEKFAIAEKIRRERKAGATTAELAEKYHYSRRMILNIIAHDRYDPKRYPGTKTTPHLHVLTYGENIMGWRK